MHMPSPNTVAPAQGLYQPDEFKDNCGFGLIAHMKGESSHHLVETAIHSLLHDAPWWYCRRWQDGRWLRLIIGDAKAIFP